MTVLYIILFFVLVVEVKIIFHSGRNIKNLKAFIQAEVISKPTTLEEEKKEG